MLGKGDNRFFLHDRGGQRRIEEFTEPITGSWSRALNDVSQATVVVPTGPSWLGHVRAGRHELVVERNGQRVWEGPIVRLSHSASTVSVLARDVLWWTQRRQHRGRFTDSVNAVDEARQAIVDAFAYDDPNVSRWLTPYLVGAPSVVTAINRYDQSYWDALTDLIDQGVNLTALGRSVVLWPAARPIARTQQMRTGETLGDGIELVEDALSLATRAIATGGQTFGATTPEPRVTNEARNPALAANAGGWAAGRHFKFARVAKSWGQGGFTGRFYSNPPAKPSKHASRKKKDRYNATYQAFDGSDVVGNFRSQAIRVHEGEDVSASLDMRRYGRASRCGIRWVGIDENGIASDRSFADGPPLVLKASTQTAFVTGTVPDDVVSAFVEVFRDTNYVLPVLNADGSPKDDEDLTDDQKQPVKWKDSGDGVETTRLAIFRGRLEPWFTGDSADTAAYRYDWTGGPNASASTRTYLHPNPDAYYGLIEDAQSVPSATTRVDLEAAAKALLAPANPAPLSIDPGSAVSLLADAPVEVEHLAPGSVVPVEVTNTARHVIGACVLDTVTVSTDKGGEKVTVTLNSGQVWEVVP